MADTTILVVDDHPVFRFGMAALLSAEPGLAVVGEAATGQEALGRVVQADPDLALVDLSLPDMSGLELLRRILELRPEQRVLVLSMHDEGLYAERAIQAGACGYLMKEEGGDAIVDGVRRAAQGELVVSPRLARVLLQRTLRGTATPGGPLSALTDRELEVFELIGRGLGTREIAERLGLGTKTIETHKGNIKGKLSLRHATELTRAAVAWIEGREPG